MSSVKNKTKQTRPQKTNKEIISSNQNRGYISSMKYLRFLYVRYFIAILFFSNITWISSVWYYDKKIVIFPLVMLILIGLSLFEFIKLKHEDNLVLKKTKIALFANLVTVSMILFSFVLEPKFFLPFVKNTPESIILFSTILMIGILFSLMSIQKLKNIELGIDKISQSLKKDGHIQ